LAIGCAQRPIGQFCAHQGWFQYAPVAAPIGLDPGDEDECALLIEARHPQFADALRGDADVIAGGEPVNPRLHLAMHQVVANQLLGGDPPETWQTVQRLAGLGYDWHNIMHMIASQVTEDIYWALKEHRQPDPAAYAWRLSGRRFPRPSPMTSGHAFLIARESRDTRRYITVIEAGLNQSGEGGRVVPLARPGRIRESADSRGSISLA
jgi:hypothetical protein